MIIQIMFKTKEGKELNEDWEECLLNNHFVIESYKVIDYLPETCRYHYDYFGKHFYGRTIPELVCNIYECNFEDIFISIVGE